jgi:hypothetical protein
MNTPEITYIIRKVANSSKQDNVTHNIMIERNNASY